MDVRCEDLVFRRAGRRILDVPALRFASGRITALLGPNGSGKSTLLRLVAALEAPAAGRVLIGAEEARPERRTRESIAFAFQRPVFVAGSVRDNLELALRLRKLGADERRRRISEAADACGIDGLLDRDARRLSGGELQRVNLARALALRAPVTLLDEPLSGLDAPARAALLHELPAMLRRFATTTILVTHDRHEALDLSDDMVILIGGEVRAAGSCRAVFGEPPDVETASFLGYAIVPCESGVLAIAPGALHEGADEVALTLQVESVIELGASRRVRGTVNGARLEVSLPPGDGDIPAALPVSAPARAVRFLPG